MIPRDELMNTSSSDDLREDYGNGELAFDMELSSLNISEPSPVSTPHRASESRGWAEVNGLTGRFARMLSKVTSFDLVPESGKLVVLDAGLSVQIAFQALRENGIKSAPLWDSELRQFIGMISFSDFVEILLVCYADAQSGAMSGPSDVSPTDVKEYDAFLLNQLQRPLQYWRERLQLSPRLVFVTPDDEVLECCCVMLQQQIHRVAVLDVSSSTVLFLMTHSIILNYFLVAAGERLAANVFGLTLEESGMLRLEGVVRNVPSCALESPMIEVLKCFAAQKCSAVPLVDANGILVGVVTKSDIRGLVKEGLWEALNQSVGEMLLQRYRGQMGVDLTGRMIHPESTLQDAMSKLAQREVYRLFIVDASKRVIGVLSLSQMMRYILSVR